MSVLNEALTYKLCLTKRNPNNKHERKMKKSPRVARTLQEAEELIEAELDYVADMSGAKLFGKRK